MANLRTNNLSGEQGQKAIKGSVVFGGGDDSSAGLTIADNSDLELSSETNWTIEFWLWLNGPTHGDYDVILGKGTASGGNSYEYFVEVMSDNTLEFLTTSTGSAWTFQQQISPVLSADSWHHVAVVRNGSGSNSLKSYINGQEYGSFTAQSIHTGNSPFGIGYFAGGNNLFSKITVSNLRIVKGTSVYTAAFTPPFEELTAIPNTVLLCCQDSDNPFKEETGKTITGVGHLANGAVIHPRNNPPYGVDAGNTFGGPIQQSSQEYMYFPTGRTEERGRGRGFTGGGNNPGSTNTIQFVEIRTSGNSLDFGDLTYARQSTLGALANTTRAIWGGGQIHPANNNIMDFITTSTTGNATDFGDLTVARRNLDGTGNQTRGLFCGGQTPTLQDVIDFVTIANLGNATDFGNLSVARKDLGGASSPTRGLFLGGNAPSGSDVIDFVTIATAGNATDFGNLTVARATYGAISSKTRAVAMGGNAGAPGYANYNTIDFVTIASAGNATDFGDLITAISNASFASNSIIGLSMGGSNGSLNTIEFITIATTGNASLFGELLSTQGEGAGCSDSHGGLS